MPESANPAKETRSGTTSARKSARSSPKADSKATNPNRESVPASGTDDLNALFTMNSRALEAFHQSNEALLSAFASFADEMLKFSAQGLQMSDQWSRSLANFQDQTKESVGTSFDYARVATEEYFRSTQKLLELSQAISTDVLRSAEEDRHMESRPEESP